MQIIEMYTISPWSLSFKTKLAQSIFGWMKFVQMNDKMGRFALAKLSAGFA